MLLCWHKVNQHFPFIEVQAATAGDELQLYNTSPTTCHVMPHMSAGRVVAVLKVQLGFI